MVEVVNAQLTTVINSLEAFKRQWTPSLARHMDQIRSICAELIVDEDSDEQLTVTAQVILEQYILKLDATLADMAQQHRNVHQMLSKTGKDIDKYFVTDLGCLTRVDKSIDTDPHLHARVNALITNHLISTGKFDVADILTKEAQIPISDNPGFNVEEVRHLMDSFQKKNLAPALVWLQENAQEEEKLIFDLQKQHFIKLVEDGCTMKALEYIRRLSKHTHELASLMWAVIVKDREERYPELFNPAIWQQLELRLARVLSRSENHLSQILELGIKMVPSLITLRTLMASRPPDALFQGDELPIEVDTVNCAHSVFACPILKAQCTEQNPPMRLTCGHVISREALHKLAQAGRFVPPAHLAPSNAFSHIRLKCPYCPIESSVAEAKRVYF